MAAISNRTERLLGIVGRELQPAANISSHDRVAGLFKQHITDGNLEGIETLLKNPDASLLTPDDYGEALQKVSEGLHFHIVTSLLQPERTEKFAPSILGLAAINLVKHPQALDTIKLLVAAPRFGEVPPQMRENMILEALKANNDEMIHLLTHNSKVTKGIYQNILNALAQSQNSLYVREFLELFDDPLQSLNLVVAAQLAVRAKCLDSFLEIINSSAKKADLNQNNPNIFHRFADIDMKPLKGEIDATVFKDKISKGALGALFMACLDVGDFILPPNQFDAISVPDLRTAFLRMVRPGKVKEASTIASSQVFGDIPTNDLTDIFSEICHNISTHPSLIMILFLFLTPARLPDISAELVELFLKTSIAYTHPATPDDEDFSPLFQKLFNKTVQHKEFAKISPQVIQSSFITVATRNDEPMIQAFYTCGRFQEIMPDTLFTIFKKLYPIPKWSFAEVSTMNVRSMKGRSAASLEEIFVALYPLGSQWKGKPPSKDSIIEAIEDAHLILKEIYPIFSQINQPLFVSRFDLLFIKNPVELHNFTLGRVLVAAAGLGLWHIAHAILSSRLHEISPLSFKYAALYSVSGNQMMVIVNDQENFFDQVKECPLNLEGKAAIARMIVSRPNFHDLEFSWIKRMIASANEGENPNIVRIVQNSSRFKSLTAAEQAEALAGQEEKSPD